MIAQEDAVLGFIECSIWNVAETVPVPTTSMMSTVASTLWLMQTIAFDDPLAVCAAESTPASPARTRVDVEDEVLELEDVDDDEDVDVDDEVDVVVCAPAADASSNPTIATTGIVKVGKRLIYRPPGT